MSPLPIQYKTKFNTIRILLFIIFKTIAALLNLQSKKLYSIIIMETSSVCTVSETEHHLIATAQLELTTGV